MIKALILDLDNTIYPVPAIGDQLFAPLFALIKKSGDYEGDFEEIRRTIMRKPFQQVAKQYQFGQALYDQALPLIARLVLTVPVEPFPDYEVVRKLPHKKFLVTAGFTKMQRSKIDRMGIAGDFEEVFIVDRSVSDDTKKSVFESILQQYGLAPQEVLIIGDDLESEIRAGQELGAGVVLFDRKSKEPAQGEVPVINNYNQLGQYLD